MTLDFGEFDVHLIETGRFRLDGGAMFGVVPKVLWEKTNPADEKNRIEMALRCVLVRSRDGILLVDTGIGERWSAKHREIYAIDTLHSSLDQSLARLGIRYEEITHVVFSHLHFDHVGGATRQRPDGTIGLTFPNALHFIHPDQWQHAHAPTPKDQASFVMDYLIPLQKCGQIMEVGDQYAYMPGIKSRVTFGHTPGHQMVQIEGGGRTLIFCGDTIPTASHLPLPYIMAYDLYPLRTLEEKRQLLEEARERKWILAFSHDPFTPACQVGFEKGRYTAIPLT